MYNLPHFKAAKQEDVLAFMKANPFAVICGVDKNNHPVATHVPVLIEEKEGKIFLYAHIMRKQEHTNAFENNSNVLAIFQGPHTYISASWYENKRQGGSWNYQAVHASGTIQFLDEEGLYNLLVNLTDHFEGNPHSPSAVKNLSTEYMSSNMKAIIAFKIEVTNIQHIFKLSQNRDEKSFENIIEKLENGDAAQQYIAEEMKHIKKDIF
ncbi:MAG: hypothetical protein C0459_07840 [Chitinophaga sp.]|jgi:transcriptional regulator|nr:hypothetical protein [Chitinophaga sp.]